MPHAHWSSGESGVRSGGRLRSLAPALTAVLLAVAGVEAALTLRAVSLGWHGPIGQDFDIYMAFTRSWLDGDGWYLPAQLAGPYVVEALNGNVYPPSLLYLTVPFVVLPAFLWWTPVAIVAFTLWRHRPEWWAWPLLAFVFVYPRTWTLLVTGNPSMWAIACAVAGVVWGWPAVGAALKLTIAPLALMGIRRRSWWVAAAAAVVVSLPFGGLWLDYLTALGNAQSDRGLGYVLGEWPIALGLVAVATSGLTRVSDPMPLVDRDD